MLWLKFKDENGEEQRVGVDRDTFTVGRHSACDLTYTDSRLSREHLRIERVDGGFTAADAGSSNGTTVNGARLTGPEKLKDGDVIDLGGGLQITVELEAAEVAGPVTAEPGGDGLTAGVPVAAASPAPQAAFSPPVSQTGSGIPASLFIIAPLLGIFVLAMVVGAVVLFGGGEKEVANNGGDIDYPLNEDEDTPPVDDDEPTPKPVRTATPAVSDTPSNGGPASASPTPGGIETPLVTGGGETTKVEQNGAAFLRQIAQNDPRAFLTGEQAVKVNAKVKQLSRSSALADNIGSARKNAAAIKSLAASKNLKPQFLAVAAITRLGSTRGDVLQAAQSVADIYDKLGIQIGNENSDDALLMVAAFDQGAAGDTMKMRNLLQSLAEKPGAPGAREIRSIWFLEKTGNITSAEYERTLNFLAIGTIAQNPKDFGVNTEALRL